MVGRHRRRAPGPGLPVPDHGRLRRASAPGGSVRAPGRQRPPGPGHPGGADDDEGAFDWGEASYTSPGWSELVIYELHVGSFNESAGETIGTLADAAAKLPYLQDLGISAVELLPVATFEGAVSWEYHPGVPFSVERPYGGPDGLKAFVRAAHALGIAVILDVVYNHFGPDDSILWQFDGSGPTWNRRHLLLRRALPR